MAKSVSVKWGTLPSALLGLGMKVSDILGESGRVLGRVTEALERSFVRAQVRLLELALGYLLALAGVLFLNLGLLFLVLDYTPLPRGLAFSGVGILTILASFLLIRVRTTKGGFHDAP